VQPSQPGIGLRAAGGIERWVSYAGAVGVLGVPVFVLVCWPAGRTSRRVAHLPTAGAAAVVVAALVGLPVQAARSTGNSFLTVLHDGSVSDVLRTPYGHAAEERILCAVLAAGLWAWWRRQPRRQLLLSWLLAALALALGYAKAGHPAVGRWPRLTLADDVAHLSAVAIWLGGLAVLAGCVLPAPPDGCAAVLRRWSRLAMLAVLVLVTTGTIQAWRELRSVHALLHHSYGQWVLLKVGLLVVMVALGNLGRRRVQRYLAQDAAAVPRMRKGVVAEVGIGAAVLVATSALVVTNPGPVGAHADSSMAAMPDMAAVPAVVTGATDLPIGVHVEVRVTNPRAGTPTLQITTTRAGRPVKAAAVEVRAGLPAAGVEPIPLKVVKLARGSYEVRRAPLSIPGQWMLIITVRTSNIDAGVGSVSIQLY
jgi:copper transport protein